MGFSTVIASAPVLLALFVVGSSLALAILASTLELSGAMKALAELQSFKARSQMRIESASVDPTTRRVVTFVFYNSGSVPLWGFEDFDLVVVYTENGTGVERIAKLEYGRDWTITKVILGGYEEPYVEGRPIEPGESAVVAATLPTPAEPGSPVKVLFANRYGFVAVYKFAG